ncbi:unnamed protein product [Calypogeia fissa]
MALLKSAWENNSEPATCPHRRWDLACKCLRKTYITLQNAPKSDEEYTKALKADLRQLKPDLVDDFTEDALLEFTDKEDQLRDCEENQALHMQQLSRIRWLGQGDEPSHFFFKTLRAKQSRESMKELLLDNNDLLTEPQRIQEEVTRQCLRLYTPEESTAATSMDVREARRKFLCRTRFTFSPVEQLFLTLPPSEQELKDVLDLLLNDKAPNIDGLTAEVFRACWDFIRHGLVAMVLDFWHTSTLAHTIKEGVLKLIPKKADKRRFKDWHPLTMLTTIYKILAKFIALWLKVFLPKMISPQQTGFISGRHILENISVVWLTIDWIQAKHFSSLFLKLDFEKAFDRVSHEYLWETLLSLGLPPPCSLR